MIKFRDESNKNENFLRTEFVSAVALGAAEAARRETRKGEAGGSQEEGQTRSQRERVHRSQATPSGEFLLPHFFKIIIYM